MELFWELFGPYFCNLHSPTRALVRPSVPSVRLSVCPSVCPYVCLSVFPSVRLSVCPYVHESVCPSIRLSFCVSVRLFVCPCRQVNYLLRILHVHISQHIDVFILQTVVLSFKSELCVVRYVFRSIWQLPDHDKFCSARRTKQLPDHNS